MDIVLGVSMAPSAVRMVLVEGQNADGVTVDQDDFEIDAGGSASDRVVSAILGTRESAQQGGYRLASTGVAVPDQVQATLLRDALTGRKVDNITLVSAFLAAAALAQTVAAAIGYARIALLLVQPDSASLAAVDAADGSISDVHRAVLPADDDAAIAELTALAAAAGRLSPRPNGMLVVGAGVNVGMLKPALEAATPLPVSVPEEPETALARGAALASAHTPLFESSTSALAWARDPGTGMLDPDLAALGYAYVSNGSGDYDATVGAEALAYSAVGGEDPYSDYSTLLDEEFTAGDDGPLLDGSDAAQTAQQRKPFLLAGSALAAFFVLGVAALVVALAIGIRPTAANQPVPGPHAVVPAQQAPPSAQPAHEPAAPPAAPPVAPPPMQPREPAARHSPAPAAPPPVPEAPAPAPAPAAPPPAPAPAAPAPIPVPIVVPVPELPAPAAPAPAPPPAAPPVIPQQPAKTPPPVVKPPTQSPPKSGGGWPGWPGSGGGNPGTNPNPWLPGNSGSDRGTNPWLPGNRDSGKNPWLPGNRDSGKNPWLPGNSGKGGKGGLFPWWPGSGKNGGFGKSHSGFGF